MRSSYLLSTSTRRIAASRLRNMSAKNEQPSQEAPQEEQQAEYDAENFGT
jgi:hypothetical protein